MSSLLGSSFVKLIQHSPRSSYPSKFGPALTWSISKRFALHRPVSQDDYVRVYDPDGRIIGVKTKEEAEAMARKRNMLLIPKQVVVKPKYPEYQMEPAHQLALEIDPEVAPTKSTEEKKLPTKLLTFSSTINDEDLKVKVKHINDWIHKLHQVNVLVVGTPDKKVPMDILFDKIVQQLIPEAKVSSKELLSLSLKFIVRPDLDNLQLTQSIDRRDAADPDFVVDPSLIDSEKPLESILPPKPKK